MNRWIGIGFGTLIAMGALTGCERGPDTQESLGPQGDTAEIRESQVISGEQASLETRQKEPYGRYITDANGRALYAFMADTRNPSVSNCTDDCLHDWPALTSRDEVKAGPDVNPELVGTIERPNGGVQVTYNGWPLYYYQKDSRGDLVEGQDLMSHGAEWYILSPEGEMIRAERPPENTEQAPVNNS